MDSEPFLPRDIDRRSFLLSILATSALGATLGFGILTGRETLQNKNLYNPANPEILIKKLPKPDGFPPTAVVHLTDIHFDSNLHSPVNPNTLPLAIAKVKYALEALGFGPGNTFVTCTGDWVNSPHKVEELDEKIIRKFRSPAGSDLTLFPQALRTILSIPALAYYGVLGNHDVKNPDSRDIRKIIGNYGIQLIDEDPFQIYRIPSMPVSFIGSPDYTTNSDWYQNDSNPELQSRVIKGLRGEGNLMLLTHSPIAFDPAFSRAPKHIYDVDILCGHTHGGNFRNYTLSDKAKRYLALKKLGYRSPLVDGDYVIKGNRIRISAGIGSHPFTPKREVPAGITLYIIV